MEKSLVKCDKRKQSPIIDLTFESDSQSSPPVKIPKPSFDAFRIMTSPPKKIYFDLIEIDQKYFTRFSHSDETFTDSSFVPKWQSSISFRKFPSQFRWKGQTSDVILRTNLDPKEEQTFSSPIIHHSYLKSMLQKAIRRNFATKASHLCFELSLNSIQEILRRLPIILVEDVSLHPAFSLIVWFMVAVSKNFPPPAFLPRILSMITYDAASTQYRDVHESDRPPDSVIFDLPEGPGRDLCASLILRAQFGGMAGDMDLLMSQFYTWHKRFSGPILPREVTLGHLLMADYLHSSFLGPLARTGSFDPPVQTASIGEKFEEPERSWGFTLIDSFSVDSLEAFPPSIVFSESDLLSEGIDFHCDSQMIPWLRQSLPYIVSESDIKRVIWLFRSSLNHHRPWPCLQNPVHSLSIAKACECGDLAEKKSLLPLWRTIHPLISEYCAQKLRHFRFKILRSSTSNQHSSRGDK